MCKPKLFSKYGKQGLVHALSSFVTTELIDSSRWPLAERSAEIQVNERKHPRNFSCTCKNNATWSQIAQAYLGVVMLQPHACAQRFRFRILRRTSVRSLPGGMESIWETPSKERASAATSPSSLETCATVSWSSTLSLRSLTSASAPPLRRTRASAAVPKPPCPPPPPPCCRSPGLRPGSGGRRRPPFLPSGWAGPAPGASTCAQVLRPAARL